MNETTSPSSPTTSTYGTPPAAPTLSPAAPGMSLETERGWAVGAHLSSFVAAWLALGFMGPLVILLTGGTSSPFVRRHAVEALNFNLSVLLYAAVSALLMLVLVGFLLLPIVGLVYLVATIQGAMAASRGEEYRYPVTIRFIH